METVTILPAKGRFVLLAILPLVMIAASAFAFYAGLNGDQSMAINRIPVPPIVISLIGAVGVLFFGYFGLYILKRLFNPQPSLILSAKGLEDNSSGISAGLIPWNEITGLDIVKVTGQKMMALQIANPDAIIERFSGIKKKSVQANMKLYGTPVFIPQQSVSMKLEEIAGLIDKFKTT